MGKALSKHKLDLWKEVLPQMDRHNLDYYAGLDEDEKKSFAGIVAMRAMSQATGPNADWYLIATNERANPHFYDIYEHPELQYKLLASNGAGNKANHAWIAGTKKSSDAALRDFILRYWPHANSMEVETVLRQFDKASFSDFVDGTGTDVDDAKRIKKSFDARA
jgi:hypothetical protein